MNKHVLRMAICVSWILLIVASLFKALGADWFELSIDYERFAFLDTNIWAASAVCSCTSYIMFNIYYLAICERKHFKWWVHLAFLPYIIGSTILKMFIDARYHILVDSITTIVIPIILVFKTNKKYFNIIIGYVFNWGFGAISAFIRNLAPTTVATGSLISELVMSLDLVIMLVLYWLYSLYNNIDKEVIKNE